MNRQSAVLQGESGLRAAYEESVSWHFADV